MVTAQTYLVTTQTRHGNCAEMLLDLLSFLFSFSSYFALHGQLYLFVGKSTGLRLNTVLFKLTEFVLVRIGYQCLSNCTDPSSNCIDLF